MGQSYIVPPQYDTQIVEKKPQSNTDIRSSFVNSNNKLQLYELTGAAMTWQTVQSVPMK